MYNKRFSWSPNSMLRAKACCILCTNTGEGSVLKGFSFGSIKAALWMDGDEWQGHVEVIKQRDANGGAALPLKSKTTNILGWKIIIITINYSNREPNGSGEQVSSVFDVDKAGPHVWRVIIKRDVQVLLGIIQYLSLRLNSAGGRWDNLIGRPWVRGHDADVCEARTHMLTNTSMK